MELVLFQLFLTIFSKKIDTKLDYIICEIIINILKIMKIDDLLL